MFKYWEPLFILSFISSMCVQSPDSVVDNKIPPIGSRIRITSPRLEPGWHVGMLNRLRVEPICYRILIFGSSNTIKATLTVNDITNIQVSSIYNQGFVGNYDPTKPSYPEEKWLDVPLEELHSIDKNCKVNEP